MPQLIAPTTRLHRSWLESLDEWGPGVHQDGASLPADVPALRSAAGFADWVEQLLLQAGHILGC